MIITNKNPLYVLTNNYLCLNREFNNFIDLPGIKFKTTNVKLIWYGDSDSNFILKKLSKHDNGKLEVYIKPHKRVLNPYRLSFNIPKCLMIINNLFLNKIKIQIFCLNPFDYHIYPWPYGNVFDSGNICHQSFKGIPELIQEYDYTDIVFDLHLFAAMVHSQFFDTKFNRDLKTTNTLYKLLDNSDRKKYNIKNDEDLNVLIFRKDIEG